MSGTNGIWEIHIQKRLGTEYWTNVYHLASTNSGGDVDANALLLVAMERRIHMANVEFISYRKRPFGVGTEGTVIPLTGVGATAVQSFLPLFNVARVDFAAPTGRPSRKYYRLPVPEGSSENGSWSTAGFAEYATALTEQFDLLPDGALVDVDGQVLGPPQLQVAIGMRQLRRGSKRKQPVI